MPSNERRAGLDVRLADAGHDLAPELHGFQGIGLVDRAQLPAALARRAEPRVGDPLDLGFRIADGIEADALARRHRLDAARLAEIRVAVELAKDDEIEALDHLGLQGRGPDQLREHVRGPEIREQLQLLAQLEKAVSGPLLTRQALLPGSAGSAEKDRVGATRERKGIVR